VEIGGLGVWEWSPESNTESRVKLESLKMFTKGSPKLDKNSTKSAKRVPYFL